MDDELKDVYKNLWLELRSAALPDALHPWRNITLATNNRSGQPQLRTLILRTVNAVELTLDFHTDVRSAKWEQLQENSNAALLAYDPADRVQLRLQGRAELFGPATPEHETAWNALSNWSRTTYCGGPPGHQITGPQTPEVSKAAPDRQETEYGKLRFGVLRVEVSKIDWYQHPRGNVRRAHLTCSPQEGLLTASWVSP